jgi:hypothetical protein
LSLLKLALIEAETFLLVLKAKTQGYPEPPTANFCSKS